MERYTFAKTSRLLKPAEFQKVRAKGRRMTTRRFNLFVLPNGLAHHRLGLSVSRRVGNAVVRNRIKRWLREYFRLRGRVGPPGEMIGTGSDKAKTDGRTGGRDATLFAMLTEPSDILIIARSAEGLDCLGDIARDLADLRPARPQGRTRTEKGGGRAG